MVAAELIDIRGICVINPKMTSAAVSGMIVFFVPPETLGASPRWVAQRMRKFSPLYCDPPGGMRTGFVIELAVSEQSRSSSAWIKSMYLPFL